MAANVVLGAWTDYSQPLLSQPRLTLTNSQTNTLLIGLAVLMALTGEYLWQIVCQLIFLRRATADERDGLFHQTQLFLRNDDSPGMFAWNMWAAGRAWGRRKRRYRLRALQWMLLGLLILTLTNTTSFWLQFLASPGNVLIYAQPGVIDWNFLNQKFPNDPENSLAINRVLTEHGQRSNARDRTFVEYIDSCYPRPGWDAEYTASVAGPKTCQRWLHPYLPSTVSYPGECPFANDLCLVANDQVYQVNAEVDSLYDLGINTRHQDRVKWRTSLTCSPVKTQGYSTPNYTSVAGVDDALGFFYGASFTALESLTTTQEPPSSESGSNLTYVYTRAREEAKEQIVALGIATEDLFDPRNYNEEPLFNLSTPLRKTDDRATFLFLSSRVVVQNPIDDPFLNITTNATGLYPEYVGSAAWVASNPVTVLGCSQSTTYCNPSNDKCIKFNHHARDANHTAPFQPTWDALSLTPTQRNVAQAFAYGTAYTALGATLDSNIAGPLLLTRLIDGRFSYKFAVPDHYWQQEVRYMFNRTLAMMQAVPEILAQRPTPFEESTGIGVYAPPGDFRHYINDRVTIRDDSYQSFNLAILILIVTLQALVIFIGFYAQFIWPWLRLRRYHATDSASDKHLAHRLWQAMGSTQLHRSLHQLLKRGIWEGQWHQTPTADPRYDFAEFYEIDMSSGNDWRDDVDFPPLTSVKPASPQDSKATLPCEEIDNNNNNT